MIQYLVLPPSESKLKMAVCLRTVPQDCLRGKGGGTNEQNKDKNQSSSRKHVALSVQPLEKFVLLSRNPLRRVPGVALVNYPPTPPPLPAAR